MGPPGVGAVNRRAALGFAALLVTLCLAMALTMAGSRPSAVNFFITADTQGFLVPCGCRTVPAGGLARRAAALEAFRKACGAEAVVPIEVGHGFAERGPGRDILNGRMGNFFARTGTLVGLGSYDLLLGPEALRQAAPGVSLFLAGRPAYEGSKEFRLGGWSMGPLAFGGRTFRVVFLSATEPGGVGLDDPIRVMAREVKAHPADKYIVVGQLPTSTLTELLKVEPALLAVAAQWGTNVTSVPQRVEDGRWILYLGDRGRRAATLRVAWSSDRWSVRPEISYLGPDTPSDAKVAAEVDATLKEVEEVNAKALKGLVAPARPGEAFQGAGKCRPCHTEAHKKWAISPHARATKDLAIDHQQQNPDCLICHATGLGKPGGYPQSSPDLSGVQCEACHGPGEGHPPRQLAVQPPGPEACGRCHTERDSPLFDAEGYWKLVEHK